MSGAVHPAEPEALTLSTPMVEFAGVSKTLAGRKILDKLEFSVKRGETFVIIGYSGTGKSVSLRNLVGLMRPDEGSIRVAGEEITTMTPRELEVMRRKFGVLFQSAALLNGLTVAENVALPIQRHTDLPKSTIDLMVKLKLELVGMGSAADKYPYEVSGGMKKRAGLARAIALDPAIVFYDEPSAGLDPVMIGVIDKLIMDLTNKLGITAVVITHEMPSIFRIADEVMMLFGGRFAFRGTPQQLRNSTDPLVRQFINGDPEGPINAPRQLAELSDKLLGGSRRGQTAQGAGA